MKTIIVQLPNEVSPEDVEKVADTIRLLIKGLPGRTRDKKVHFGEVHTSL